MGVHSRNESRVKWYKPSFQWRHPLNQTALLFVFLTFFFFATKSFSAQNDQVEGYYFLTDRSGGEKFRTASEAFAYVLDTYGYLRYENVTVLGENWYRAQFFFGELYNQFQYVQAYTRQCGQYDMDDPACQIQNSCPDAGTPKRIATPVNGTINNGVFIEDVPDGGMVIEIGGGLSADGCGYATPIPDGNGVGGDVSPDTKVKCDPNSGQCFRFSTYVSTGQARDPGEGEATSTVIGDPESIVQEQDTAPDTRIDHTTVTGTEPVTEQVGDKQITTETQTTIETRGDGSVVETRDDITTVTQTDGITRTDTVTTTTTTNADGSKTVNTTNNISYTQHPQTVFNIDNSTNRISVTNVPGASASSSSTTTDTFAPDGTRTSSQTTQGPLEGDQAAQDAADEAGQEDDCQATGNCPQSYGEADYGEPESLWETGYPEGITGVFNDAQTQLRNNALVKGFTTGSFPNSGSLPTFSIPGLSLGGFSMPGGEIQLDPKVQPFLIAAFYIMTLFVCRRLILGG